MMGTMIRSKKKVIRELLSTHSLLLYFVLLSLALLPLSACRKGGGVEGKSEVGSIAFSVQVPGKTQIEQTSVYSRAAHLFDCTEYGIATIEADVYDGSDNLIAEGGPWNCDAGEGIVSNITPGENRRVVILCFNGEGTLIYRGEASGILVVQGQTTNAGNIAVSFVGNHAPVLSPIGTQSESAGSPIQFTISATDEDGDSLTYEMGNAPNANMSFDPATRQFSWNTSLADAGEYRVFFIVHDDGTPRMSDYEEVTIRADTFAAAVPHHPVLAPIGPQLVDPGDILSIQLEATDADAGSTFAYYGAPVYGKDRYPNPYDPGVESGLFTWDTTSAIPGNYYVVFTVYDDSELSDSEEMTITVGDVNRPPVLTPIGDRRGQAGETLSFIVTATDPEGDAVEFSFEDALQDTLPLPLEDLQLDANQVFTWTIDPLSIPGDYMVRIIVTDSNGETDFEDVMISVDGLVN